jgi:hypothetical protein
MDHHDVKIGQVEAAISPLQNRIVPFGDLSEEDARQRFWCESDSFRGTG